MAVLVLDKIGIWANSRSVYVHPFRSTGSLKKARHSLMAGLLANFKGLLLSMFLCNGGLKWPGVVRSLLCMKLCKTSYYLRSQAFPPSSI